MFDYNMLLVQFKPTEYERRLIELLHHGIIDSIDNDTQDTGVCSIMCMTISSGTLGYVCTFMLS